jgi:hypothetical protein
MSAPRSARRTLGLATAALLAAAPAHAGAAEADVGRSPNDVVSAVTLDMNGDGRFDRAVLVEEDDTVTLLVYLSAPDRDDRRDRRLAIVKPAVAWNGGMWGQQPSLEVNARGSLLVRSANESIGRDRWSQTLTVAYKNGTFLVAGLTFNRRDSLDPEAATACDLNYLSGQGIRNGKPIRLAARTPLLADWSDEARPKECGS